MTKESVSLVGPYRAEANLRPHHALNLGLLLYLMHHSR